MAAAQQAFVVPVGDLWVVKVGGVEKSERYALQSTAITFARTWLRMSGGGELVILGEDGKIRDKDTVAPGNDPRGNG